MSSRTDHATRTPRARRRRPDAPSGPDSGTGRGAGSGAGADPAADVGPGAGEQPFSRHQNPHGDRVGAPGADGHRSPGGDRPGGPRGDVRKGRSEGRHEGRHEDWLDGLFTYCLSVLCDHDAALDVLREVLDLAERRHTRAPKDADDLCAWLYALARWICLRRMAEDRRLRHTASATARAGGRAGRLPEPDEETAHARRLELASLAWPEAAGTSPEQREALELAVRHGLSPQQVASVVGLAPIAARELLAAAACEVERTRAALGVAATGGCPVAIRYAGDRRIPLGAALRGELVRHVDDCPRCRRTAERAGAGDPWPGTAVTPDSLPVIPAPRAALVALAKLPVPRRKGAAAPRFDRGGFPMDPKDRAARRERLRARAVTTTVVATVVAAPVFALWAAYRGVPFTDHSPEGRHAVTAPDADGRGGPGQNRYEDSGGAKGGDGRPGHRAGKGAKGVSATVIDPGGKHGKGTTGLAVAARTSGDTTFVTLTAKGAGDIRWTLASRAAWLSIGRSSGRLAPGESVTVPVRVVPDRTPERPWSAAVTVAPTGALVQVSGPGRSRPAPPRPPAGGNGAGHSTAPTPQVTDEAPQPPPEPEPQPSSPEPEPTEPAATPPPDPPVTEPTTAPTEEPAPAQDGAVRKHRHH
ncbi:sigma-70 family RNA polymerase sigma factor [Streptomyces sp. NPDC049954]|uniref:BACON domain-containing protein n=1 Tax=Streptomyces sp. NPDC049954 TaxID=3155779 RepID=UPI00342E35EC